MRSDFFAFWLKIIFVVVVAATLVNDGGSILMTHYWIGGEAELVAREALRNYRLFSSETQAVKAAQVRAQQDGAVLTGFQITSSAVRVAIEIPAKSTWVAHRFEGLKPYLSAQDQFDLPLNIRL